MDYPPSSFAFPLINGSANFLAKKDLSDVGSLACRVTFKPVSASLQDGVRFFGHPNPAHPWAHLAVRLPVSAGGVRGFHVPLLEAIVG